MRCASPMRGAHIQIAKVHLLAGMLPEALDALEARTVQLTKLRAPAESASALHAHDVTHRRCGAPLPAR